MPACSKQSIDEFMEEVKQRNPGESEFHKAVHEVAQDIIPFISDQDQLRTLRVLQRIAEPDRALSFRVVWEDDEGALQINRGFRVQQNNAIGPYKGGLRFHASASISAWQIASKA